MLLALELTVTSFLQDVEVEDVLTLSSPIILRAIPNKYTMRNRFYRNAHPEEENLPLSDILPSEGLLLPLLLRFAFNLNKILGDRFDGNIEKDYNKLQTRAKNNIEPLLQV